MNFKCFLLLIMMAHLLSECWNAPGHFENDDDLDDLSVADRKVLQGLSQANISVNRYYAVKVRLRILKERIANEKKERAVEKGVEKGEKGVEKGEKDKLLVNITKLDEKYGKICRAIKMHDWVVDLETNYLPPWLHYTEVSRYFKWVIALHCAEGEYFDVLRSDLNKRNILYTKFAAEIQKIYDTAPSFFAHYILGISKPSHDEADLFCQFFESSDTPEAKYACKVVIGIAPEEPQSVSNEASESISKSVEETTVSKSVGTSTSYYTTRINIVITGVSTAISDLNTQYIGVKKAIENTPQFITEKCIIMTSQILHGNPASTSEYGKRSKQDLAGMVFILDTPMNLNDGLDDERYKKCEAYKQLKKALQKQIQSAFKQKDIDIFIIDDYSYITATLR